MRKHQILNRRIEDGINAIYDNNILQSTDKIKTAKDRLDIVGMIKLGALEDIKFDTNPEARNMVQNFIKNNFQSRKINPSFSAFVITLNVIFAFSDSDEVDYTPGFVEEANEIATKHFGDEFMVPYKASQGMILLKRERADLKHPEDKELIKSYDTIITEFGRLVGRNASFFADFDVSIPESILISLIPDNNKKYDVELIDTGGISLTILKTLFNEDENKEKDVSLWKRFSKEAEGVVNERLALDKQILDLDEDKIDKLSPREDEGDERAQEEIAAGMLDWLGEKVFKTDFGLKDKVGKIYDKEATKAFEPYRIPLKKINYPVEKVEEFIAKGVTAEDVVEMCEDILAKSDSGTNTDDILSNAKKDINKIKERVDVFIYLADLKNELEEKIGPEKTRDVIESLDRYMVERKII